MGYLLTNLSRIWETALSAIGSHLTLGLGGILFLGFPVSFWAGSYAYAIAARAGWEAPAAFLVGLTLALLSGILFAFFYARMSNDSFAVITLASVLAADALLRSWDAVTGGVLGISGVPRPDWAQTLRELTAFQAGIALLGLAAEGILVHSPFGRSLRALKENRSALAALGTSPDRTGQAAIIFGCFLAGLAGILAVSRIQFLDPSLGGFVLLVQVLTIAIIANSPSVLRLFALTALIVLLPELLRVLQLPVLILGHLRTILYGLALVFLIHYLVYHTSLKRNV